MKNILVIEIDITGFGDSWTIDIQKSGLTLGSGAESQLITKRSSRDRVICFPVPGDDNFVKSVTQETHE